MPYPAPLPRSTDDRPLLDVAGLACARGDRPLFEGLSFALVPGDLLWLRGPNGIGKTTLLRALLGLVSPSDGHVRWHDGASCTWLSHANALKDDLTVRESLRFLDRLHGGTADDAALDAALAAMGVRPLARRPVRTLSQGQRRRTALARLALPQATERPGCWLLDEPYDALDTDGVDRLDRLLMAHADRGGAVLFTSHLPVSGLQPWLQVLDLGAHRARRSPLGRVQSPAVREVAA